MTWEGVTTALTNLGSVITTVMSTVSDNPVLMVFIAAPVLGVGIAAFNKFIHIG